MILSSDSVTVVAPMREVTREKMSLVSSPSASCTVMGLSRFPLHRIELEKNFSLPLFSFLPSEFPQFMQMHLDFLGPSRHEMYFLSFFYFVVATCPSLGAR